MTPGAYFLVLSFAFQRLAPAAALPLIREVFARDDREDEDDDDDDNDEHDDLAPTGRKSHSLSSGAIAGIVCGIVVLAILAAVVTHYWRLKARKERTAQRSEELAALASFKDAPPAQLGPHAVQAHRSLGTESEHAFSVVEPPQASTSVSALTPDHQDMVAYQKQLVSEADKQSGEVREVVAPPSYQER